jgi:NAD(P)-dependent dehydrogenase (short-subunit alcohol dehydrogenase family)
MTKVVLVTGANKGIGFEVSREFGRAGFTVLLGARDLERGEEAASKLRGEGLDVRFAKADLNHAAESGAALAKQIGEEFGHLDVLVNTFETNFFGTVAFTQPLLPLLKAADSARIVNVSSGLGSLAINGDPGSPFYHMKILGYNASKAALNMFTVVLAYDLRDTKIKVNSVCPGYTATDLNNHSGHQTVEEGAIAIVRVAQLPEDGPTASFIHKDGTYSW